MMELKDFIPAKSATAEDWLMGSGLFKTEPITKKELIKLLSAYRGFIYEAEFRPEIHYPDGRVE